MMPRTKLQPEGYFMGFDLSRPEPTPFPPRRHPPGRYSLRRYSNYHSRYGDQRGFWRCKKPISFLLLLRLQARPKWVPEAEWTFEDKRRAAAQANRWRKHVPPTRIRARRPANQPRTHICLCERAFAYEEEYRRHYAYCIPF